MKPSDKAREAAIRAIENCEGEWGNTDGCVDCVATEIDRQVAAEKERCARVAEGLPLFREETGSDGDVRLLPNGPCEAAAAIRGSNP
jgi:hypothetical protein